MFIKFIIRCKYAFIKSINDNLFRRCYKVCFDKIVLIFVLLVIIFRSKVNFIKVFRKDILIENILIMLIILLII